MSGPSLLAVAHGSSHPAATAAVAALAAQVVRLAPVIDIRLAYLQHAPPSIADGLAAAGPDAVIVPLLLSAGFHLSADIARAASNAGLPPSQIAGPLGPDPLLVTAICARLAEAGVPAGTPIVLAAAGSSDPAAAADVSLQAQWLADSLGVPVLAAFAATGRPTPARAVADLRSRTTGPVAVASYLLAPGQFHNRLAESGADWITAPLAGHPAVAGLVIDRYRAATRAS